MRPYAKSSAAGATPDATTVTSAAPTTCGSVDVMPAKASVNNVTTTSAVKWAASAPSAADGGGVPLYLPASDLAALRVSCSSASCSRPATTTAVAASDASS